MSRKLAREAAMKLIYQKDMTQQQEVDEYIFKEMIADYKLTIKDLDYVRLVLKELETNRSEIDQHIVSYTKDWTFERLARVDLAIMRLAICEMIYLDAIPRSVSINEAVELAKKFSDGKAGSYINGILASIFQNLEHRGSEVEGY